MVIGPPTLGEACPSSVSMYPAHSAANVFQYRLYINIDRIVSLT
jgi:hypothetical protein